MSKVAELYDKIKLEIQADPSILHEVGISLSKIINSAYTQVMSSDEGYCFKFTLPMTAVMKLIKTMRLDKDELGRAFKADWKYPSNATMYNDPYYHILHFLIYYGIREDDEFIIKNSLLVSLMKIWNGRKAKYMKYCDKRIMNYVISHMLNNKHLASKYDSPLILLKDYFTPTLLKKYMPEIKKSPLALKNLFMQSFARVRQLYVSNMRTDITTGKKMAQGGLMVLYMKAREEGLHMTTPAVYGTGEDEATFDQYSTVHNRDEISTSTSDYITMNPNPTYPKPFISTVNSLTKVSTKVIEKILTSIHNHLYYDMIHDIISIMLSRTNVAEKDDICKPEFFNLIKKNVISSKNNPDARKIQKLLNLLLDKIFEASLGFKFTKYSNVQQIQIRNVVIYGLVYNLRRNICQGQIVGKTFK